MKFSMKQIINLLYIIKNEDMNMNLVAIKCEDFENSWYIVDKDYFEKYGRISDKHLNIHLIGMEEIADSTFQTLDKSNGIKLLELNNIPILEEPVWYFSEKYRYNNIKKIADEQFLNNLAECACTYGWNGDYHEVVAFVNWVFDVTESKHVDLTPYDII